MKSRSDSEVIDERCDFGRFLSEARKIKNFSISDINERIKISTEVLTAIEASDITALPASTFTRGYIRTYAKFLEISEDEVLDAYHRALPGKSTSALKPRSNLPTEARNLSPLIKTVTVFLAIAAVAALIYGSVQYYLKKADVMESELESKEHSFTGNSLDSPGSQPLEITQHARLTEDAELILQQADSDELMAEELMAEQGEVKTGLSDTLIEPESGLASIHQEKAASVATPDETIVEPLVEPGDDIIEFYAQDGSWMEVRDANNTRLFYNMLPEGGRRTLKGRAPFSVSMGNAETTTV